MVVVLPLGSGVTVHNHAELFLLVVLLVVATIIGCAVPMLYGHLLDLNTFL